ncbi:MAG: TldD/PmbA family protein [Candidatus Nitrosocaldus sp.]|nr:TldD/PmbA family protein [Candidatus Nitrosocaldus sp.]MDW8000013.1 TldD/PmbA family protein [Candidatus Nitrosocaldus sp.]
MVKYLDIKVCHTRCNSLVFKGDAIASREDDDIVITARAVANGYGIASTGNLPYRGESVHSSPSPAQHSHIHPLDHRIESIVEQAIEHALASPIPPSYGRGSLNLAEVEVERGSIAPAGNVGHEEGSYELIEYVTSMLRSRLPEDVRVEVSLTCEESDDGLVSSEGADVRECRVTTTIDIRLMLRQHGDIIQVSKSMGGRGGMEVLKRKSMDDALDEMVDTVKHLMHAKQFSILESGRRYTVILDNEAGGALARLIGKMLEADEFNPKIFSSLHVQEGLEVVDDPTLPNGYGSFTWDDEGVRGRRKVLLSSGTTSLLHTRLTASTPADEHSIPGNARRGVDGIPKPAMSNVYIKPMDWHVDEMVDDARECILMRGVSRATADTARGMVEVKPAIAYHVKDKEIVHAIRGISIQDSIRNILNGMDAVSRVAILRPYRDERYGFRMGEGSPYIRLGSARCVYALM